MARSLPIRRHRRAFGVVRLVAHLLAMGFAVGLMEGPDCLAVLLHAGHARQPIRATSVQMESSER
jgi:hypothetical protein